MKPHFHQDDLIFYVRQRSSDIPIIKEVIRDDNYKIKGRLKGGEVVIDIGGHIGSFSVFAGSMGAVVLTYEPVKRNFRLLEKNVKINDFNNTIFNMAVTSKEETRRIFVRDFNFGGSNLYYPHANPDFYEDVVCTTLDKIYDDNHLDRCDYLKLDCEGSEFEIIENFKRIDTIKTIGLEYHGSERRDQVIKLLAKTHNMVSGKVSDLMGTMIFELK
jgi:FkbM family methyltransferase